MKGDIKKAQRFPLCQMAEGLFQKHLHSNRGLLKNFPISLLSTQLQQAWLFEIFVIVIFLFFGVGAEGGGLISNIRKAIKGML